MPLPIETLPCPGKVLLDLILAELDEGFVAEPELETMLMALVEKAGEASGTCDRDRR